MKYWIFKQYISDAGRMEFEEWVNEQPKAAKAAIHETMDQIEIREQLGFPHTKKLKGYDEIWELKTRADNVQYRPLFCEGTEEREICFLIGATKTGGRRGKNTKFKPINAPKTAEKRRKLILKDRRYIVEYRRTKKRDI